MLVRTDELEATASVWTNHVKRAVLAAGTICVDFHAESVELRLKRRFTSANPFEDGMERCLIIPGFRGAIVAGYADATTSIPNSNHKEFDRSDANVYAPSEGCWVFMSAQHFPTVRSILLSIPVGAQVCFRVVLDAASNHHCARCSLHGDAIVIAAETEKRQLEFVLDTEFCTHSVHRFGYPR